MSHLLFPILSILSDGKFHSGEAMAKHFKVSRVAIWHAIAEAEKLGVEVFSVRGKGYRLIQPLSLIEEEKIKLAVLQVIAENEAIANDIKVIFEKIENP